jgi:membrane-associated phospholipid phosphatase
MNAAVSQRSRTSCAAGALTLIVIAGGALFGALWLLLPTEGGSGIDHAAFTALTLRRDTFLAVHAGTLATLTTVVVAALAVVTVALLLRRRRWRDAAVIVAGYLLVDLAAHAAKGAAQRPRPPHELLYAGGFSFPSTHSAASVVVVALAVSLARLTDRRSHRAAIVTLGCVAAAVIGLALIAVRVHYLTDVLAGWGLGASVFAACALGAMATDAALAQRARAAVAR